MIEYCNDISAEEYMNLRRLAGWTEFPLSEAQEGLDHTYRIFCARDQGKAIGVTRLLWDWGYTAYLADVIIDPAYQRQGIGTKLVKWCIETLKADMKPGYKVKFSLQAAKGKETFYTKFGFQERPNETTGAGMDQWIVK